MQDDAPPPDEILDALGLLCPLPVLKARKRIRALQAGQILRLISDDPAAPIDVQHFCNEEGHALLRMTPIEEGGHLFDIRKGPR